MLITLEKDKTAVKSIEDEIKKKANITGLRTRVLEDSARNTIHIRGMDALCEKAEVLEALEKLIPGVGAHLQMGEMRPFRNNTQAITININSTYLNKILAAEEIRIGCTICTIEKKYTVNKCRKCWRSGHLERDCKGEDLKERCFKCGELDHKAKDCTNNEKCPLCKEEGHRAGSGRCRDFRRHLSQLRRQESIGKSAIRRQKSSQGPSQFISEN
ncbi:hypothetical protein ABEB36_015844 [Hypothenemus hampei]|uniref:CCHC-type domain-containing protein n=1 Tax=Hypothenemus hampei TaxID=57062 RepID=A0ABD1DYK7_HYPHA